MTDRIEQIRAAHLAARPKPAVNPAWANAEHDIGVLLAEIDALKEAITPSAATKAAYIGEFSFGVTLRAGSQEDYRRIEVPWTTIKEIMVAIAERAARSENGHG